MASRFLGKVKAKIAISQKELAAKVKKKAAPVVAARIAKAKAEIVAETKALIRNEFEKSNAIQALQGDRAGDTDGYDLQAEFGLSDYAAGIAIKEILDYVSSSSNIQLERSTGNLVPGDRNIIISYVISGFDPEIYIANLRNIPSGRYVSQPSKVVIPWIDIMLGDDVNIIENIRLWGIVFNDGDESKEYDDDDPGGAFNSRSGRAIMTKQLGVIQGGKGSGKDYDRGGNTIKADRFPYTIPPEALSGGPGDNFVDTVINNVGFQKKLKQVLRDTVIKYANKR